MNKKTTFVEIRSDKENGIIYIMNFPEKTKIEDLTYILYCLERIKLELVLHIDKQSISLREGLK